MTGVAPHKLVQTVKADWGRLTLSKGILRSPYYLRENGRPVIAFKGVGIKGAGQDLAGWFQIIKDVREFTEGGAYIVFCGTLGWVAA